MDRSIAYSTEQIRLFDWLNQNIDALIGSANYAQMLLGKTETVIQGLTTTANSPPNFAVNIAPGFIIAQAPVDSSAYGSQPANTQQVMQLGYNVVTSLPISLAALAPGQSQYAMIQAGFKQVDSIAPGDPNGGILPYININNPSQPFNGPNNSGVPQNTLRQATCDLNVIYSAPVTTGLETPPTPTSGYVPVTLIDLTYGQSSITNGDLLNPNNVSGSLPTPVLAGLLNSHHGNIEGQAPGIILTNGQEVQGHLPIANMVASNNVGAVASFRTHAGNPNGALAGNANVNGANDFCWDSVGLALYMCSTTGNAGSAVWTGISAGASISIVFNLLTFTSSGNYTPTAGAKYVRVTVVGAGGGGGSGCLPSSGGSSNSGGAGGGGGGGGTTGIIPTSALTTPVTITVGTGGAGGNGGSSGFVNGGNGGSTSFGSYLSATGGVGGFYANATLCGSGRPGGIGAHGGGINSIDFAGNAGSSGGNNNAGSGGGSFFGGGGAGGYDASGGGAAGRAYGGGGGGGYNQFGVGGNGANGAVLIEEYIGP